MDQSETASGKSGPDVEAVVPLVEERAVVSKRAVAGDRVRIRTVTEAAEQLVREEIAGERVEVERVPIDRPIGPDERAPEIRTEGGVTIVPVVEEVLVVTKQLVLKEELRITRAATREKVEVPVTVRRQRAVVERDDFEGSDEAAQNPSHEERQPS
jgi:stress response protein YsnF